MYNQTEAVLAQYDLEIKQTTKGRGNYICETDRGPMLLVPFRGSQERGEWLQGYLEQLLQQGYAVEQIYRNGRGEVVTVDEVTGEGFLLKDYISGSEIGTTRYGDMMEALEELGRYHRLSRQVENDRTPTTRQWEGNASEAAIEIRKRHQRELVKVRNYIRGRKKKMEFEQMYLSHVPRMLETAGHSIEILQGQQDVTETIVVCHGDCNQHNVIWSGGRWRLINFENAYYGWGTCDLANFIRKMLEKNGWDAELGMELVWSYDKVHPLGEAGYRQLYGLLLFPEKFWKIANHYMNSNKAWIPQRDIEKMEKVISQEELRLKFLEKLFPIL